MQYVTACVDILGDAIITRVSPHRSHSPIDRRPTLPYTMLHARACKPSPCTSIVGANNHHRTKKNHQPPTHPEMNSHQTNHHLVSGVKAAATWRNSLQLLEVAVVPIHRHHRNLQNLYHPNTLVHTRSRHPSPAASPPQEVVLQPHP